MSTYVRSPRTITVHCPHCPWLRTVFEESWKHKSLEARAAKTLQAHVQGMHSKDRKVVIINGR